jgi:HPt (histidine-containing phosphotransfer) domain-containing protein
MGDQISVPVSLPTAFDVADALNRVAGDRELLAELVYIARAESPRLLSEIQHSVESNDADGLERATHRLRGSVGVFGAHSVSKAALELELMARQRILIGAPGKLVELRDALHQLDADLATFSEDPSL